MNNQMQNAMDLGTKVSSGWLILKAIGTMVVVTILAILMLLTGTTWFFAFLLFLVFLIGTILYIRHELKVMKGEIKPQTTIQIGKKGKPTKVKR